MENTITILSEEDATDTLGLECFQHALEAAVFQARKDGATKINLSIGTTIGRSFLALNYSTDKDD